MSITDYNASNGWSSFEYLGTTEIDLSSSILATVSRFSATVSIVNVTSPTATQPEQANLLEGLIIPLYGTIFLLSMIGNSLVLITLARNKRMRTVTNVYLLNLAVSDLLLGVFCIPFTLLGQLLKTFVFGITMCKLIAYFQAVSVSVGVWTLVAISLERYFAICRPLKSRRWQTQFHAYKMIAVVWTASLTWNAPILVVSQLESINGGRRKCREKWPSVGTERAYNIFLDGTLLLIPLIVMSLAYSLIAVKLWRGLQQEIRQTSNCQQQLQRMGSIGTTHNSAYGNGDRGTSATLVLNACGTSSGLRRGFSSSQGYFQGATQGVPSRVIRMLFVIVLEFFVCWAPLYVMNTWYLFTPELVYSVVGSTGISLVHLLAYVSSCCNPITYCFMNRKFRQAFLGLFDCHRCWRVGCGNGDIAMAATRNAVRVGNNNELSGNDSTLYLGRASLVARSEVVRLLEEEDRV